VSRSAIRTFHHEFFDDLAKLLHVVFGEVFAALGCLEPLVGPGRFLQSGRARDGNGDLRGHDEEGLAESVVEGNEEEGSWAAAAEEELLAVAAPEEGAPDWLRGAAAPVRRLRMRST
jgi:hypothetical protein